MKLSEEIKEDLKFSFECAEEKLRDLPHLHMKYFDRLNISKLNHKKISIAIKKSRKDWYEYYLGRKANEKGKVCPLTLNIKEVMDIYLPGQDDLIDMEKKLAVEEANIRLLETAIKQIDQLYWLIKTTLDYQKYKEGV